MSSRAAEKQRRREERLRLLRRRRRVAGSVTPMRVRRSCLAAALAASVLALTACGGSDDSTVSQSEAQDTPAQGAAETGMQHIHGLGVRGATLFIATHGGLWVAADGQTKPRRVDDSQQDIMGFSVLSKNRFIGSGHPHPSQQDQPPNLGLIESRDGGKSWKNISLAGDADFHVLQSSGRRVYGFDGTQGRLMVSSDGGRSWQQRTPPAAIFGLAIDPTKHDRVVVATGRGTFSTSDAGKTWRPLDERLAGLLAWPRPKQLYLVDGQGQVRLSRDGGRQWHVVGSVGGQPAAFIAGATDLYAALADGSVKRSTDGGQTWTVRATP